jgi:hypothetical protein
VDAILIGRKIHAHESPEGLFIHPLRPGYTLITSGHGLRHRAYYSP